MPDSDSSYVVVARRYRPRGFEELVGQEHVGRALKNAIQTNRVGHAYLFTGARGVGKTSTARIFAKALNDPSGPTPTPDNESDVALAIDSGEDVDVIEIDGASNRGIDEIRSLRANVGVRPSRSRFKIYIIDEVHMLTGAAFNALLKTLEEPPEHVKFIFCTTDPEKIPITVLSRCQRFDFAPVEVTKIVGRLKEIVTAENASADDDALELIARRAAGSMRDSQSLLEQVLSFCDSDLTAEQVHAMLGTADDERLHALAMSMADRDAAESLRQMDAGIDAGVDAGRLAEQLLGYFRDLMAVTVGCDASMLRHTSVGMCDDLKALGDRWGLQTVLAVVGLIDQTLVRIRHSVYSRVLLEATVIQICNLPDLQHIADLASAAQSVGGSVAKAKPKPTDTASEKKNVANTSVVPKPHLPAVESTRPEPSAPDSPNAGSPSPGSAALVADPEPVAAAVESSAAATSVAVAAAPEVATAVVAATVAAVATAPSAAPSAAPAPTVSVTEESESTTALETETAEQPAAEAEGEPKQESEAREIQELTAASASKIWAEAADEVETGVGGMARSVERVELTDGGTLRLLFPADAKLSFNRFEAGTNKSTMIESIARLTGRTVKIESTLGKSARVAPKPTPQKSSKDRMARVREIQANPMIEAFKELFEAEIAKVDPPK